MWAAVAYLLVSAQLITVGGHTSDYYSVAEADCVGSKQDGAKLASSNLGRTLLQDSSKH
jgi:hypothetical protein